MLCSLIGFYLVLLSLWFQLHKWGKQTCIRRDATHKSANQGYAACGTSGNWSYPDRILAVGPLRAAAQLQTYIEAAGPFVAERCLATLQEMDARSEVTKLQHAVFPDSHWTGELATLSRNGILLQGSCDKVNALLDCMNTCAMINQTRS